MPVCKTIGCNVPIDTPDHDFCPTCEWIHSLLGLPGSSEEQADDDEIVVVLDTYKIHHGFNVQDPSGCLQEASKLILTSGQANPYSDFPQAEDILKARSLLTRWLQINEYEAEDEAHSALL